ncbi:MAG: 3-hydroxyacyl-CoA dehydrogenase NAD-binding domain-containing protein [Gammaproteobacteria bacterium]|nr:3-hydroxyacyl-CoA dehydrogenase NAD-binding domain-containing protein [Gammaproteobacteria bacterium]
MSNQQYQHWKIENDDQGILWLHIDQAGASTNVLCVPVLEELEQILLDAQKSSHKPLGIVFVSDKPNGFIAGADIKEFLKIENNDQAVAHIRRGQAIMDMIENMKMPTVALIHGFCMGGGLELALACKYRIADDGPKTKLGLPEIQLGIHPGFGGTVRLPHIIGAPAAMDMMLTGKAIPAKKAAKMGFVDFAVPTRQLKSAARQVILERTKKRPLSTLQKLTNNSLVRPILANMMRKQVAKKARKEHYPAPYALIDLWARFADNRKRMMEEEAKSVARLVIGETAQSLIRVFFLRENLKGLGKSSKAFEKAKHVHVIGAGVMGGDIAAWCAFRGLQVTLQDRNPATLAKAMARANGLFEKKYRGDRLAVIAARDRLTPDIKGLGVPKADVIIEAIVENIEAKQTLFRELEPRMKSDALLTTNTSSIPLEVLSEALERPERLVGLHFFNPVAMMPLIEIVESKVTDKDVAARTAAFAVQIDRLPLPVKSGPGFLVNRVLMPYMLEAVKMKEEGMNPELIDKAALQFGMPMGPLRLADTVGLDICLHVAEILSKDLDVEVPQSLKRMVEKGQLGVKSGSGFYHYKNGKKVDGKSKIEGRPAPEMIERMMARMLNECVACLREGVVADTDQLDAGVIFGTGFAPFRGGPLHYAKHHGIKEYKDNLNRLEKRHGGMFKPDDGWDDLAPTA